MDSGNKKSLRSRMILTLTLAIAFVFIILAFAFNILFGGFIKREAVKELKDTITQISAVRDELKNTDALFSDESLSSVVKKLQGLKRVRQVFAEQDFILLDKNYKILFPRNQDDGSISRNQANKLVDRLMNGTPKKEKPEEIRFGNKTYYAAMLPAAAGTGEPRAYIVVYSDVSGMNSFRSLINRVLVFSVLLSGIFAILFVILFSSRTVKSFNRLCQFARSIESGNLEPQYLKFKEKELQALSDDMNRMALRLSEQEGEQKTFFQNISHEFKTPLMSIQGYAEGLKYGIIPDRGKACDIITHECAQLSELVNDLLFMSRFESRRDEVVLKEADMRILLADWCDSLYGIASQTNKTIELKLPEMPVKVLADEEKLSRAFSNLLSNGLRHAAKTVAVACIRKDGMVVVSVTDDGAGLDPADVPHLFKRFYKGKNGSSGLGLAIAKAIVEAHKGTISACNTQTGAQFAITLKEAGNT